MASRLSVSSRIAIQSVLGVGFFAALLFVPAGSLRYWQGWLFMAAFILPSIYVTIYMYRHDPALLQRRMRTREKDPAQRRIMTALKVALFLGMVVAGLDRRFGWSRVPWALVVASDAMILLGYALIYWVLRVNSFAATTIVVESGQRVITNGPYGIVRHPMYLGAGIMVLFAPFALGSYWSLIGFLPGFPLIVLRILNEERLLRRDLAGYSDYCRRTRYRLVPLVW